MSLDIAKDDKSTASSSRPMTTNPTSIRATPMRANRSIRGNSLATSLYARKNTFHGGRYEDV